MAEEKKKKKKFNIVKTLINVFCLVLALSIFVITFAVGVFMYLNSPVTAKPITLIDGDSIRSDEDGAYFIDIRRGETSQSVGMRLERNGFINSRYLWNLLCRFSKEPVKTGTYRIEMPLSLIAIHDILISGREILYKVTIPEGVTIRKMAIIFEEAGICSTDEFLASAHDSAILDSYDIPNKSMEGYLFPDTYLFPSEYPPAMIIKKMTDNFFNKIESVYPQVRDMSMKELNDKIILASIVEREYRIKEEAPLMAGVFINRLKINMALQSCATVQYIITEIQGKPHPNVILLQDLEIRNPYNTYIYPGLPPGPISTPGFTALNAVLNPEDTNYLYFRLTDPQSGRHYFSRSYDDHIRAGQLLPKPSWP